MAEDEHRRKQEKPTTTPAEAATLARSLYNINAVTPLKSLDSYDDRNFYVPPTPTTAAYLLKVHNGVESDNTDILDAQNAIMIFLANEGFTCSVPIESLHGRLTESTSTPKRWFAVRLLAWVEGRTLNSLAPNFERLRLSGRFLGQLRSKLDHFDHKGCHREHLWDIRQTSGLRRFLHALKNVPHIHAVATQVVDAFDKIQPKLNALKWGTLQADFNDANIIFNEKGTHVVGVIDFGDIVYSNRINDVAIAMAYMMLRPPPGLSTVETAAIFLQGYCETNDIDSGELEVLRILVACRLTCSVTLGAFSSMQDQSGNAYLQLHAAPGRKALVDFWSVKRERVNVLFQNAATKGLQVRRAAVAAADAAKKKQQASRQVMVGAVGILVVVSCFKSIIGMV